MALAIWHTSIGSKGFLRIKSRSLRPSLAIISSHE
jgi:hypothetical protein